jgi:hypothetical protein
LRLGLSRIPLAEPKSEAIQDKEEEMDSRSIGDRPARAPSRFEEFWKAYLRRDGPNPRKPAQAKFNALEKRASIRKC